MSNPEARLVRQILEKLGETFPASYFRKIHGNPYQHAGIPDIIGCVSGIFVGLEVKTDIGKPSQIQLLEGLAIRKAQGVFAVIRTAQEAIDVINDHISSDESI